MAEKEDDPKRIEGLLATTGLLFRRRFLEAVTQIQDRWQLQELEELLAARRFDEALVAAELAAANLANGFSTAYLLSADDTMRFIGNSINVVVSFDRTNDGAVERMRQNQLRLVQQFTREQRLATRFAMVEGIAQGLNPRQQALLFRQSIGLTRRQVQAVLNYRRLLEEGDAAALQRALRDRRFDPSVRAAVSGDRPLTSDQINRMVDRYRERYISYRSEVIARTEALRAVHEGAQSAYRQAITDGLLDKDELVQEWVTASDERVRSSHSAMHGQQRPIGEPFLSGAGNLIKYPGDIDAPGSETIQCRCVLTTRFAIDAVPAEV
jgi:hypothetical protein